MEHHILHIAEELKTGLKTDPETGRRSLEQFARNYGFTKRLTHAALILNLNFTKARDKSEKEEIITAMKNLVDEIVKDHQTNQGKKDLAELSQARTRYSERLLQKELPEEVVFSCRNLKCSFRKGDFTLGELDLALRLGEITGVVGENGNGKTTLFRIIAGELRHGSGDLTYPLFQPPGSKTLDWVKIKRHTAYVPQELPPMYGSLKDNIKYEAALHGILGEQNEEETNYVVQRLGLDEHLGKNWSELSGGFKLRFSLAKAVVWKPQLLIIDEPLANLDIKTQLVILQDLRELSRSLRFPMSLLISSQHLHEIEAVSDKILFLEKGQASFYDRTEMLGEARNANLFELGCEADLDTIKNTLQEIPHHRVYFNGISYVIRTPLEVSYKDLLYRLLVENIKINYFRDISRSVKGLFEL